MSKPHVGTCSFRCTQIHGPVPHEQAKKYFVQSADCRGRFTSKATQRTYFHKGFHIRPMESVGSHVWAAGPKASCILLGPGRCICLLALPCRKPPANSWSSPTTTCKEKEAPSTVQNWPPFFDRKQNADGQATQNKLPTHTHTQTHWHLAPSRHTLAPSFNAKNKHENKHKFSRICTDE